MKSFVNKLVLYNFNKKEISKTPRTPGVYIFYDKNQKVQYVGKSISLRNRLLSYLGNNLGSKTSELMNLVIYFSFIEVNSEVESLLFESYLVKKFMPKYNIALKDDKTPLYVVIVKDKYPWVKVSRRTQLGEYKKSDVYGPFISGQKVNTVLRTLRPIFPFSTHPLSKKPCFYSHIGLCIPCPNNIDQEKDEKLKDEFYRTYKTNISFLRKIFNGQIGYIKKQLENNMNKSAKKQNFEEAKLFKQKLDALNYVTSQHQNPGSYFENPSLIQDIIQNEISELNNFVSSYIKTRFIKRIECFDIAHISGNFPTASMVTFVNGTADKSLYRHFRIRQSKGSSDTDSLNEVAKRRIRYLKGWGKPDLIIVDGGKGQVSKFFDIFNSHKIPVVGIAKRQEQMVFIKSEGDKKFFKIVKIPDGGALFLVQKLRNEAHRFARLYHHQLFKKNLIPA